MKMALDFFPKFAAAQNFAAVCNCLDYKYKPDKETANKQVGDWCSAFQFQATSAAKSNINKTYIMGLFPHF